MKWVIVFLLMWGMWHPPIPQDPPLKHCPRHSIALRCREMFPMVVTR